MNADIERLAREAGMTRFNVRRGFVGGDAGIVAVEFGASPEDLTKFAALIAEECAKAVEQTDLTAASLYNQQPSGARYQNFSQPPTAAQLIRAKFPAPGGGE